MVQPLPQPFEVSAAPVLQAMRLGSADRLAEEQRGALKTAGGFAAKGQLGQARNYLYQQGMMEEADKFGAQIRQADADALAKVHRSQAVLGNLALAADTPEKWAAAVDAAAKGGIDVTKFKDFGSRDMLLAQSGMVGQKIEFEMKRRALETKETPPQWDFTKDGAGNKYTGEFRPYAGTSPDAGDLDKGYRWRMKDGKKELDPSGRPIAEPIPGGKDESVSAEVAARIGLADKFSKDLPALEKEVQSGTLNSIDFQLGRGKAGEVYRRIEDGSEALVRNLTGAGMNETEAKSYAERFLPGRLDLPSTKLEKLRNLGRNLKAVRNRVLVGRGIANLDDLNEALGEKSQDSIVNEQSARGTPNDPLGILGN